jgi:hypothetical protein
VNSIPARLIAGRRYHAPLLAISYRNGFSAVIGIVALFNGGIKGVHIYMDDLAVHIRKYTFISRKNSKESDKLSQDQKFFIYIFSIKIVIFA